MNACVRAYDIFTHILFHSFHFLPFPSSFFCGWWISSVWQFLSNLWVNKRRIKRIQCVYRSKKTCKYNATMDSRIQTHTHIRSTKQMYQIQRLFFPFAHRKLIFRFLNIHFQHNAQKWKKQRKEEEEGKKLMKPIQRKTKEKYDNLIPLWWCGWWACVSVCVCVAKIATSICSDFSLNATMQTHEWWRMFFLHNCVTHQLLGIYFLYLFFVSIKIKVKTKIRNNNFCRTFCFHFSDCRHCLWFD